MDKIYVIDVGNGESYEDYYHSPIAFALTREEAQAYIDRRSTPEITNAVNEWEARYEAINADMNKLCPAYPFRPTVKTPTVSRVINPKMHEEYAKRVAEVEADHKIAMAAYNHAYDEWEKTKLAAIEAIGPRPDYLNPEDCSIIEVERVK
jgi:hypothetical protein